jgi:proton glutamate symport protein
LIRSIIAPLLFATLVVGIAGAGDMKRMGRIGLKAILYFEVVTTFALFLGLGVVNVVRPGDGVPITRSAADAALPQNQATLSTILEHTFPASIIDAMAKNDVLQVVVFTLLFGAACAGIGAKAEPVVNFCGSLAEVMFRYTKYVMYLAPIGVGAAIAVTVGSRNRRAVRAGEADRHDVCRADPLRSNCARSVVAIARIPLRSFYQAVKEPFLIAFSTASSEAALPLALENMEKFRGAQAHRRVRHPDRVQLQSGRHHVVSFAGVGVCRAGRWR